MNKNIDWNKIHLYKCKKCGYSITYLEVTRTKLCPIKGCHGVMWRID